jgi:hypothetical protein
MQEHVFWQEKKFFGPGLPATQQESLELEKHI